MQWGISGGHDMVCVVIHLCQHYATPIQQQALQTCHIFGKGSAEAAELDIRALSNTKVLTALQTLHPFGKSSDDNV